MQSLTATWFEEMQRIIKRGFGYNLTDQELGTLQRGLDYLSAVVDQAGTLQVDYAKLDTDYGSLREQWAELRMKYEAALNIIRELAEDIRDLEEELDLKELEPGPSTTWYAGWTQGWNAQREGRSMAECGPSYERFIAGWEKAIKAFDSLIVEEQEAGEYDEWEDFVEDITDVIEELFEEDDDHFVITLHFCEDEEEDDLPPEEEQDSRLRAFFGPRCKVTEEQLHEKHYKEDFGPDMPVTEPPAPSIKETVQEAQKAYNKMMEISPSDYYKMSHKIEMYERRIAQLERELTER